MEWSPSAPACSSRMTDSCQAGSHPPHIDARKPTLQRSQESYTQQPELNLLRGNGFQRIY